MPDNLNTTLSDADSDTEYIRSKPPQKTKRRGSSKSCGGIDLDEVEAFLEKISKESEQVRTEHSDIRDTNHKHTKRIHNLRLQYEDARGRLDRLLKKTTPMSRNPERSNSATSPSRRSTDDDDKDYSCFDYSGLDYSKRSRDFDADRRRGSRDSEVFGDYDNRSRDSSDGEYYRRGSFRGSENGDSRLSNKRDSLTPFNKQYSRQRSSSIEIEHQESLVSMKSRQSSGSSDNGDRPTFNTQTSEVSIMTTNLTQPKPKGFQMVSLKVKVDDD